jgi:hypothetical protein
MEASVCSAWKNYSYSNAPNLGVLLEAFSYWDMGKNYLCNGSYKGEAIAYNSDNNSFILKDMIKLKN